ncbi:hypothetical protein B2G69_07270 [Methylorubrum zatmanii]|nr:hypothetical protein [Methylorubrum zatmanii]ARO53970.1 hypothetical protein B2G69_07270 [Methylorubrum zatmanii]
MEPAPVLRVDTLTRDVVDARAVVREHEGPLLLRGKPPQHAGEAEDAWWKRVSRARGVGSRFVIVPDPALARHPLHEEAVALKARLAELGDVALQRAQELEEARRFPNGRPRPTHGE